MGIINRKSYEKKSVNSVFSEQKENYFGNMETSKEPENFFFFFFEVRTLPIPIISYPLEFKMDPHMPTASSTTPKGVRSCFLEHKNWQLKTENM